MTDVRKVVFDNLNNAMENDFNVSAYSGNDIVRELKSLASDCEDHRR